MEEKQINTPFRGLKSAGYAEGISYLLLLAVAMPLKYFAGIPVAVRIAGSLHGIFFIWFLIALINMSVTYRWPLKKAIRAFGASLIPFGTFYLDRFLIDHPKVHHQKDSAVSRK